MSSNARTTNSRLILARQPCPHCPSSDGYHIYSDDHGYCFVCQTYDSQAIDVECVIDGTHQVHKVPIINPMEDNFSYQYLPFRGISKETMQFYGVQTKVNSEGKPVALGFPYGDSATKVRSIDKKEFHSVGNMREAGLFGADKFSKGAARSITITEGELDALSVFQMLGSSYPAVSVRSASSADTDCKRFRDFVNGFERIYLCFDNDKPGKDAKAAVARLFDFNKVYDVDLSEYKDANDYLQNGKETEFKRIWFNARRFLPEGIISSQSDFDTIIDTTVKKESVSFPFGTLQDMTFGLRTGEVVLFTAMEGIGKTEVVRAIEYHLLTNTEDNVGIIHLEEDKARNLKGLAGYELSTPCHLPDAMVSNEDIKAALHKLTKRDERLHLYNHFGSDDPDIILDTIRFLVASCNCKWITLDHITMVVSGLGDEDERKALDYISTRLAMMVKELDFGLLLVSHVNDEGKTRGSRNISKIADCWVHLDRDQQAPTEEQRNTTNLTVRKNRFGARTGPSGKLYFDIGTFKLNEIKETDMKLPPIEVDG